MGTRDTTDSTDSTDSTDTGPSTTGDPGYVMGRTAHETRRLHRQGQLYGPLTRRLFVEAGIGPGMRVLDVGSGAGDVALLLADLVGPTGAVVGIDPNAAILEVARQRVRAVGWTNVTFVEGDVRSASFPEPFDAAVSRFVLVWVRDPAAVLRACARLVRPGGLVVSQEHDLLGYQAYPPSPLLDAVLERVRPLLARQGIDAAIAYWRYAHYLSAGLPAPQLREEAPIGGGAEWVGDDTFADHIRRRNPS